EEGTGGAGSSAHDRPGTEALAQVEEHRLQARLLDLARHHQHAESARIQARSEQLPVAAVAGDDDDRATLGACRLDVLPAGELDMRREVRRRRMAQDEALC